MELNPRLQEKILSMSKRENSLESIPKTSTKLLLQNFKVVLFISPEEKEITFQDFHRLREHNRGII